jgi:hypothetical protein
MVPQVLLLIVCELEGGPHRPIRTLVPSLPVLLSRQWKARRPKLKETRALADGQTMAWNLSRSNATAMCKNASHQVAANRAIYLAVGMKMTRAPHEC